MGRPSLLGLAAVVGSLAGADHPNARPPTVISGADPVLAAAGDIACSPNDSAFNGGAGTATRCRMAATSDRLLALGGELSAVLALGDIQYETGRLEAFQQSYGPTWGRLGSLVRPVPGNHEYRTAGAAGYFGYFGAAAGDPAEGWYSFDLGAWHLVVLNSNCAEVGGCGAGSPQHAWLLDDLAAHPSDCVLAAWHHPRWSSGAHGDDPATAAFWEALYAAGADVVLGGHDHLYERFAPQDAAGRADAVRGMRAFVVGTGGKVLVPRVTIRANSEVIDDRNFGVLELTLRPTTYEWRFLPLGAGAPGDSGAGRCSRPSSLHTLTPCRLLDTRAAPGPAGGPVLEAGVARRVNLAGRCGIPADATAVSANVTVVGASAAGRLEIWPAGSIRAGITAVAFRSPGARATANILPLGVDGAVDLEAAMPSGTAHVIIDTSGYFG
jgi:hypothetical protein